MEFYYIAQNGGEVCFHFLPFYDTDASKDQMIQIVDRAGDRIYLIRRGVGHNIGTDSQIQLSPLKYSPQTIQVIGIGQIDRCVMGEEIHIKGICDGHTDDLTANQRRLSLLGPGEFVNGQIDFKAQITDSLYDALVRQREGVEGSGEESCLWATFEGEGADFDLLTDNETINMG